MNEYDPAEVERLLRQAHNTEFSMSVASIRAMADQLDAARAEIDAMAARLAAAEDTERESDDAIERTLTEQREDISRLRSALDTATAASQLARSGAAEAVHDHDRLSNENEQLRAEIIKLREEFGHATAHDGDWLSKTSRAMCETVMGDREALRSKVRELEAEVARMRPVVEAAERWGQGVVSNELPAALIAYRASKP